MESSFFYMDYFDSTMLTGIKKQLKKLGSKVSRLVRTHPRNTSVE